MRKALVIALAAGLTACGSAKEEPTVSEVTAQEAPAAVAAPAAAPTASEQLAAVLAAQPAETQARYGARHPQETLDFFGIEPGMTVIEALPGGGWYSKILLPYLGSEGKLIGVDYALDMFPLFGFFSDEDIKAKEVWRETWMADAEGWRSDDSAALDAFVFGSMPEAMAGTVDAVVMVRALHNLARFESQGGFLTAALADAHKALKPGGILAVVQHQASEDSDDGWADGSNGYLKKSRLVDIMSAAGFTLESESDINANPKDQPGAEDFVWRLPPSLVTSRENPELRAEMEAIGESNRMTLLFRKAG